MVLPILMGLAGSALGGTTALGAASAALSPLVAGAVGSGIGSFIETGSLEDAAMTGITSLAGGAALGGTVGNLAQGAGNLMSGTSAQAVSAGTQAAGQAAGQAAAQGAGQMAATGVPAAAAPSAGMAGAEAAAQATGSAALDGAMYPDINTIGEAFSPSRLGGALSDPALMAGATGAVIGGMYGMPAGEQESSLNKPLYDHSKQQPGPGRSAYNAPSSANLTSGVETNYGVPTNYQSTNPEEMAVGGMVERRGPKTEQYAVPVNTGGNPYDPNYQGAGYSGVQMYRPTVSEIPLNDSAEMIHTREVPVVEDPVTSPGGKGGIGSYLDQLPRGDLIRARRFLQGDLRDRREEEEEEAKKPTKTDTSHGSGNTMGSESSYNLGNSASEVQYAMHGHKMAEGGQVEARDPYRRDAIEQLLTRNNYAQPEMVVYNPSADALTQGYEMDYGSAPDETGVPQFGNQPTLGVPMNPVSPQDVVDAASEPTLQDALTSPDGRMMSPGVDQAKYMAEGGEVEGIASLKAPTTNEKDVVAEAIAAIQGQHPQPEIAVGRYLAQYGPEELRRLVSDVRSGRTTKPTPGGDGMMRGAGDGMSDKIPAKVPGSHDVLMSDGEFVIPADVVSDLGNGSSDAGSERLYEMLDRVRERRNGKKVQPNKIEPEKVMPA